MSTHAPDGYNYDSIMPDSGVAQQNSGRLSVANIRRLTDSSSDAPAAESSSIASGWLSAFFASYSNLPGSSNHRDEYSFYPGF